MCIRDSLTDEERFQSLSAGMVEDLPDLSQGGDHCTVVKRLALLASLLSLQTIGTDLADGVLAVLTGVGTVLVEDLGLLLAIPGLTVPGSQGVHVLVAGMHVHLLGRAPSGRVLGDILVDATEPAW